MTSEQPLSKRLVGRARGYDIYSVSAFEVRNVNESDEEFGLYGTHPNLPDLIPDGEIWLAEEGKDEWPIFIAGALKWLATGSYDEAIKEERRLRGGLSLGPLDDAIYLRYYRSIGPINVWFVDGRLVRNRFKTDFVEGGHHYVYPWIPIDEIWLADAVEEEWPFLLIHEYTELLLMRDKCMTYADAHEKADDVEIEARKKHLRR